MIDRTARVVNALQRGNSSLYLVCLEATRYSGADTKVLADMLLKSVSQIENYRYAGFGLMMAKPAPEVRCKLSPSHFAVIYLTQRQIEYEPEMAKLYAIQAATIGYDSEALRQYIEDDNLVPPKPVTLGDKWFQKGWEWTEALLDFHVKQKAQQLFREFQQIAKGEL
jgi:hypothetical protein